MNEWEVPELERALLDGQEPPVGLGEIIAKRAEFDFIEHDRWLDEWRVLPPSWKPEDIHPVLAGEVTLQEPRYLRRTDGIALFYPGKVNGIHSPTETGKSWIAALVCAEALADGDRVAYFDFESDAAEIVGRLMALGAPNIGELFDYYRPEEPISVREAKFFSQPGYAVAVFDGVTEALSQLGLNSNADVEIAAFYRRLPRRLADSGACAVTTDHDPKAGGPQRFAGGSQHKLSGITGAAYGLEIVKFFGRGLVGEAKLSFSKDRPGIVRGKLNGARLAASVTLDATADPLMLKLGPPRSTPDGDWQPTRLMENVSRYVEAGDEAVSQRMILDGVSGKRDYKVQAIEALVQGEYLLVSKGPRGARLHTSLKPYREVIES